MTKISLRHLRCFVAVAETASFTVAAARLYQTQSSLTATIQQFEEAVGLKLFDRTTRRVVLTEDAARFKVVADNVLRHFDNAINDLQAISKSQCGHVRIAAAASMLVYAVTPALAVFRRTYPNITISVRDGGSDTIERAVLSGEVDFGVACPLHNFPDLSYVPIFTDPYGVIFPEDHPLAEKQGVIKWADLAPYDYIALTDDTGIGAFLKNCPELGLQARGELYDHASSTMSLYAILSLGGKISVLPTVAAHASGLANFKFVELSEPTITRKICLVTRNFRSFSANTQRIVDVLMATIRDRGHFNGAKAVPQGACSDAITPDRLWEMTETCITPEGL